PRARPRAAPSDRVPGFGPPLHPIGAESLLGSWPGCATIMHPTTTRRSTAAVTMSETPPATRDFLAYLACTTATTDLAATIAAIVERRHAVARLEQRKAS